MKILDKNVAEFIGVGDRTLRNWKKPQQVVGGTAVYLPHGKHNLYIGAKLAYYLLSFPTRKAEDLTEEEIVEHGDEEGGPFSNLDRLVDGIIRLKGLVNIGCNSKYKEDILKEAEELEKIIKGLQNAASL